MSKYEQEQQKIEEIRAFARSTAKSFSKDI
jgi:hypothetical protein